MIFAIIAQPYVIGSVMNRIAVKKKNGTKSSLIDFPHFVRKREKRKESKGMRDCGSFG